MAERRMFAKTIIDSDAFLDMPISARLLYYDLGMRADDDGFVNNPKKIARIIGASDDDLKVLLSKSFILSFDTGVIVIKHWRLNNYIRNDRYKETVYKEEKAILIEKDNKVYSVGIPNDNQRYTQVRLGKYSINNKEKEIYKEKESKPGIPKNKYGEFQNVLLTEDEYRKLEKSNLLSYIEKLSSYIASKGKKYKSHYATILNWYRKDNPNSKPIPEWFNKEFESSGDEESDEDFKNFIEEFKNVGGKK